MNTHIYIGIAITMDEIDNSRERIKVERIERERERSRRIEGL
jgi:hypothetical protein